MKSIIYKVLIAFAIFGIHYFFIGILRSNIYTYIMLGTAILAIITGLIFLFDSIGTNNPKSYTIGEICAMYVLITIMFPMTNIGTADKTKLFTIQMTYYDGYTETATYELPEDAELYLDSGGRYSSGTDLEYRNFPLHGGLIQNNIVRYKIVSIKDK